jgi:hypothetical protein
VVASGNEVGKISIRVVPNLEDFHDDLERQLKAEEKKQRDKAAAKAKVRADTEEYEEDLGEANKRASKNAKLSPGFDPSNFTKDYERSTKDLAAVDVNAKFRQDSLDELRQNLKRLKSDVDKALFSDAAQGLVAKIRAELDPSSKREIQSELAALRGLTFDIEPRLDSNFGDRLQARLALAKLSVPVTVDVIAADPKNQLRGFAGIDNTVVRTMGAVSKFTDGALSGLEGIAKGASKAGLAILRMGDAFWILLAVVAVAAPALALLAGTLVALPGLLTAFAVPLAAVALGMDGIKEAAKAAQPAFDKLKATMSETFQNGMTPGFQLLADKLFPRLQAALPKVAESLSGLFDVFTKTITDKGNLDKIEGTIRGIANALSQAAPGVASFTNAFTSLINSTAGPLLSSLSGTVNKLGAEFEAWVGKVTANGQLQQAMDTLKGTFGEIGGILKDITSYSFDALADPAFGEKMKGFVQDVRALVNDVLPLLKSGFEDVAQIISGIRDTVDAIKSAGNWIEKITGGKNEIKGPKQTEGFAGLFGRDGVLGDNAPFRNSDWGGGIFKELFPTNEAKRYGNEAGQAFQEGLTESATPQGGGGDVFNDYVETAKQQLATGIGSTAGVPFDAAGIAEGIRNQLSGQIQAAITDAQASIQQLGPTLQASIDAAITPLSTLPTKIGESFGLLSASVGGAFTAVQTVVTENITGIVNAIGVGFDGIPARLNVAFAALGASVAGAMIALKGVVTSNATGIADAFGQAFSGAAGRVSSALAGVTGAIASALTPALGVVASTVAGILQSLQGGLAAVVPVVEGSFAAVPAVISAKMAEANAAVAAGGQQMVSTALGFAGAMESAGRSIGASFAAGIASTAGIVAAAANSLMLAAKPFFPNSPAKEGPFSGRGWVSYSGQAVGEDFAKGMQGTQGTVVDTARALMQAVKDIFGSAEGLTLEGSYGSVE